MSNNILLGKRRGLEELVEQWRQYSTYFDNIELQLGHVAKLSAKFTWAYSTLSVTITDTTLVHLFPHLQIGTKDNKLACVRSKLQGQRLVLPHRVCFEWDEDAKRVTQLETVVDFISPLLHVLGSLQDVVMVLKDARITPDCAIGDIGKEDP
ncbi:Hypothetical protein PHPALM_19455 [Phytophthora palmivora]|uniref:Bzip transcription factor n=1 Tax=Phytophthora palmivora TaxID=4796 RepID=A0A2P4XHD2_9STRA|nr:Hypothetical protein PHPALM_19455 [Phytophthora palmivora]